VFAIGLPIGTEAPISCGPRMGWQQANVVLSVGP
jgi:hypothetical protein